MLEREPESTMLRECAALGLWWVVVPSEFGPMLRLARDREGTDLLPTPSEDNRRLTEALGEERKARTLAEHERMLEQHARELAEKQRAMAEQKQALAEDELRELRAENERLRADLARAQGPR